MLLDVAEGTASQLYQHCGCDLPCFDQTLCTLRVLWISHAHADHICGFAALIESLFQARFRQSRRHRTSRTHQSNDYENKEGNEKIEHGQHDHKVLVFAPPAVLRFFRYCLEVAGLEDLVSLKDIQVSCLAGDHVEVNKASNGVVKSIVSVPVFHCKHAYGLVVTLLLPSPDGIGEGQPVTLVYSGDCRPSQSLAAAGRNCHLLIHEATFADDRSADAKKKMHCTRKEAMVVSGAMKAQYTVLTHFSQRYPMTTGEEGCGMAPYGVTFDFLSFSFPSHAAILAPVTHSLASLLAQAQAERRRVEEE